MACCGWCSLRSIWCSLVNVLHPGSIGSGDDFVKSPRGRLISRLKLSNGLPVLISFSAQSGLSAPAILMLSGEMFTLPQTPRFTVLICLVQVGPCPGELARLPRRIFSTRIRDAASSTIFTSDPHILQHHACGRHAGIRIMIVVTACRLLRAAPCVLCC